MVKLGVLPWGKANTCLWLSGCPVFFITDGAGSMDSSAIIWAMSTPSLHSLGLSLACPSISCLDQTPFW
jgi:hypothetical protein